MTLLKKRDFRILWCHVINKKIKKIYLTVQNHNVKKIIFNLNKQEQASKIIRIIKTRFLCLKIILNLNEILWIYQDKRNNHNIHLYLLLKQIKLKDNLLTFLILLTNILEWLYQNSDLLFLMIMTLRIFLIFHLLVLSKWRIMLTTLVNGIIRKDMAEVNKFGVMDRYMKDIF